ncbi:GNAT family N-acetyltransferase [Pseudomonas thivervalensis]|uniref:N-acetyltransferase n=1 Tax=Pseudomonas thivervalensis TaxID=86265 RepID=A0A176NTV8_9PSED|nr:GNAT family N-acetyltransferase [Pseudomonas thivervalensis]AXA53062.1 N-acetyltransferase [Pseudomonas thivervalensis]AXA58779.1 N-acetyltransferase [Pseudomonas thivervalensis]OAB54524.1 GCN5 family acetyltransferase [Pseudomonas thivervalensis]SDF30600.1 Acetyltransferase (GNAT) family protein [Pseudomonas thivervalensis]
MTLRIERTDTPTDEERQAILAPLRGYNTAQTGGSAPELVAWLVRDEQGEIVGGLYGRVFFRWLYIELLVVPEQARGQGTGSTLMQMAEELAREKNCVGIWLDTFDFQAPAFYRKHGFTEIGQIDDYPPGHQRFFFQKRLTAAD